MSWLLTHTGPILFEHMLLGHTIQVD